MHDFFCRDAEKMYYSVLADRVDFCKHNRREEPEMCDVLEELMAKREARGEARGRAEGEARGETRGKENIAVTMLRAREPMERIVRYTSVPAERVAELGRQYNIA